MGEGLLAVVVICVTAVIIAAIAAYVKIMGREPQERIVYKEAEPQKRVSFAGEDITEYASEFAWEDLKPVEAPHKSGMPPMPIDPKNPPKRMTFPMGNPLTPPLCMCHSKPVVGGQEVFAWKDGAGYRFTCVAEGK